MIEKIANNCIYGIDYGKDPPLARVARINMYLHGDGGSRIYYADALDKDIDHQSQIDGEIISNMEELKHKLDEIGFDVVLTNPPFSMTKETKNPTELRILEQYGLARENTHSTTIRSSLKSGVMFIERYYDILRPGGLLITVIDETLLSAPMFDYVRDYIRRRFIIKAIISLPGDTFRRSGSRVKTSVLVLEKKRELTEEQPDVFYHFSEHLGVDDKPTKASPHEVQEARQNADKETDDIVNQFLDFNSGREVENVLSAGYLNDRLDLRSCVPQFGRMNHLWIKKGIHVRRLDDIVFPSSTIINPSEYPDISFKLIKVSYDGYCELEKMQKGCHIRHLTMYKVVEGQLVFSVYNALNGAVGIVPPALDGALVSTSSYTLFNCHPPPDVAYLWSLLRSHEIRADIQSISTGSGRYTSKWPGVGQILIPWEKDDVRTDIGNRLIKLWDTERQIENLRRQGLLHLDDLGVESEASRRRLKVSKAPQ